MNEQGLIRLREFLFKEFNEEELATLCQDIGLNYERLPGEGAFGKTREMIEAAQTRDMTALLMSRVRDLRPEAYRIAAIRQSGAHMALTRQPAPSPQPTPERHARRLARQLLRVVLVIAVCAIMSIGASMLNQEMLDRRAGATPSPAVAAGTATKVASAITATEPVETAIPATEVAAVNPTDLPAAPMAGSATPIATANREQLTPTTPSESLPTQTPQPTVVTATPTPLPKVIATLTPTAVPYAPVQVVIAANDLLAAFYSGKVSSDALRDVWVNDTYTFVITYPTRIVQRNLGLDIRPGDGFTATLSYVQLPVVASENGGRVRLTSREYWAYFVGDRVVCETVDYSYTLTGPADRYQIVAYKGDVLSTSTGSACE